MCKEFYLKTLNIDSKRIVNAQESKNMVTGTPRPYIRGKHTKKSCRAQRDSVRRHIESIPVVVSHYCRRDTNKSYIDGRMNLQMLYEKYVEDCQQTDLVPAKLHMYRDVFNHEYNIDFVKPKKDRCDTCEAAKVDCSEGPKPQFAEHLRGQNPTMREIKTDRLATSALYVSTCRMFLHYR